MKPSVYKVVFFNLFILILHINVTAQKKTYSNCYENGKLKSKGQTYTYPVFYEDKRVPKSMHFADYEKKIKKWEYWYPNGQLQRVEHYKLVRDRSSQNLPHGKWIYYNETGTKYREEIYNDGVLTNTFKEVFREGSNAGFVSLNNGVTDTAIYLPVTKDKNLIINSDFDFNYYKPVQISYDGETRIEDWIPYWTTPGQYTPDYLSNLRNINALSYSHIFNMTLPDKFNYVGIFLYKESDSYSEYIQGKLTTTLKKGNKYCLRTSINICSYSKYSVNRLAFLLSASPVSVNLKNETDFSPQIIFSNLPVESKHFTTLCGSFIASGDEQFITVGRFIGPENMNPILRDEYVLGPFVDRASYYVFDNIELFEIQESSECDCKSEILPISPVEIKPELLYETDINKIKQGTIVVLENINFKFDSYILLPESTDILNKLLNYLENNPGLKISIEGHTCDIGSDQYNNELSTNRARSVYLWLINNGIEQERLSFKGFGKNRPIFDESDEDHRELNRRVEVRILKE